MKKLLIIVTLALSASAFAQSTATQTATATGTATNAGNSQSITFTSPPVTTSTSTVNQTLNGTQTINQNQTIAGTTTQNVNNTQSVSGTQTQNVVYGGEQTVKNVPSVSGPNLTTSNDTCMGSTSGSVNIAGLGIGGGSSWVDGNCKMLKNSRELWNMGMKAAALALMCGDAANKEALELTGFVCPQTAKAKESTSKAETDSQYTGNDPIVRARLGLAPLNTLASK